MFLSPLTICFKGQQSVTSLVQFTHQFNQIQQLPSAKCEVRNSKFEMHYNILQNSAIQCELASFNQTELTFVQNNNLTLLNFIETRVFEKILLQRDHVQKFTDFMENYCSLLCMYCNKKANKNRILQYFLAFSNFQKCEHFLASIIVCDSIRQLCLNLLREVIPHIDY
eukprot:EC097476.1.p1 GENE.EC097476.1~~EC097476.1.p1  ORF type:complete len:168 (+),score=4.36 EC097476.1:31-534(+)